MIDLHCHILPGVDDGPDTFDEALDMARAAVAEGVRTIVATPHFGDTARRKAVQSRQVLEEFRDRLRRLELQLAVLPGAEVVLDPNLPRLAGAGELPTINDGPYLLVESDFHAFPPNAEHVFFQLQTLGLRPILAHPERCVAWQDDATLLAALVNRGVLAQVNAGSLVGAYGEHARRVARDLVKSRLVQVIGSDAHSAGIRTTFMREAVAEAAQLIGQAAAEDLVTTIPSAIVAGRPVPVPMVGPAASSRRPWWRVWRR